MNPRVTVCACAVVALSLQACARVDTFYLVDARMPHVGVSRDGLEKGTLLDKLLLPHRIASGQDVVLAYRRFDPGNIFTVDDERYEQLTLELPKIEQGSTIDLSKAKGRVFYSEGSSAFATRGYGRYSIEANGCLSIEQVATNSVTATLNAEFITESASLLEVGRRLVRRAGRFIFLRKELSGLTPWLGQETEALDMAAYRQ